MSYHNSGRPMDDGYPDGPSKAQIAEREEWLKGESNVFILFEGCCPTCFDDVSVRHIGGIETFLEEHETYCKEAEDHSVWNRSSIDEWDEQDEIWTEGGIEFICPNGHKSYIEKNCFGDWN